MCCVVVVHQFACFLALPCICVELVCLCLCVCVKKIAASVSISSLQKILLHTFFLCMYVWGFTLFYFCCCCCYYTYTLIDRQIESLALSFFVLCESLLSHTYHTIFFVEKKAAAMIITPSFSSCCCNRSRYRHPCNIYRAKIHSISIYLSLILSFHKMCVCNNDGQWQQQQQIYKNDDNWTRICKV